MQRGRRPKSERNAAIIAAVAGGVSHRTLALIFGVCYQRISQIVAAPAKARVRRLKTARGKEQRIARLDKVFAAVAGG